MKLFLTLFFTFFITFTFSQLEDSKITQDSLPKHHKEKWVLLVDYGTIRLQEKEPTFSKLKEKTLVGFDIGVTRNFKNNLYLSSSITFSVFKEVPDFYRNEFNYFSANLDLGYKFKSKSLTEPYFAIGTSLINAPATIADSNSSFSLNFTGGVIFWLRNPNYGLVIENTYKSVSTKDMVPHNRFTLGIRYKI